MKLCTTNFGKVREFGGLLLPLDIEIEPITDRDIPETGDTFRHNSTEKALSYAAGLKGHWVLAEDSGLVVAALEGLPGPWSARFADLDRETRKVKDSGRPREVMDPLNSALLLNLLKETPVEKRSAYFVACITIINPEGEIAFQTECRANGWIRERPSGNKGFGYDSIFESPESFGQSWAEIDSARKGLLSHRSKAVWTFMTWLCSTDQEVF